MSTAVFDLPAATPTPVLRAASAAVRLILRTSLGVVVLALLALVAGPRLYHFQSFYVRSGSMTPTIPVGSLVIATRAPAAELGVGDVILFHRPDQPTTMVVHRIFAVDQTPAGRGLRTTGEAKTRPSGLSVPVLGAGERVGVPPSP